MHISSYIFSHMLYQMLLCALQTGVTMYITKLTGVKYPVEGLITPWLIVDIGISLLLITYASDMLSLWVSTLAHTTTTAMTIMPFLLIVQLLLSGFVFSLDGVMKALSNATISKWGLNAICIAADVNHLSVPSDNYIMAALKNDYYDQYNPKQFHLLRIWLILLLITVIFVLLTRLFISTVEKDKR